MTAEPAYRLSPDPMTVVLSRSSEVVKCMGDGYAAPLPPESEWEDVARRSLSAYRVALRDAQSRTLEEVTQDRHWLHARWGKPLLSEDQLARMWEAAWEHYESILKLSDDEAVEYMVSKLESGAVWHSVALNRGPVVTVFEGYVFLREALKDFLGDRKLILVDENGAEFYEPGAVHEDLPHEGT